jgi:hypothetical protein
MPSTRIADAIGAPEHASQNNAPRVPRNAGTAAVAMCHAGTLGATGASGHEGTGLALARCGVRDSWT